MPIPAYLPMPEKRTGAAWLSPTNVYGNLWLFLLDGTHRIYAVNYDPKAYAFVSTSTEGWNSETIAYSIYPFLRRSRSVKRMQMPSLTSVRIWTIIITDIRTPNLDYLRRSKVIAGYYSTIVYYDTVARRRKRLYHSIRSIILTWPHILSFFLPSVVHLFRSRHPQT